MSSNLKVNTILPSTGTTVTVSGIASVTSSVSIASSCTATTFYGSGANLTSLPAQATIANNADNRVITGGSGVNLNGESNLTFDGTDLFVANNIKHLGDTDTSIGFDDNTIKFDTASGERLRIDSSGDIITQGLTTRSFNNDSSNAKVLEVTGDGTVGEYGVLNLSGNLNSSSTVGAIKFINRENSNSSSGSSANSKNLATIDVFADTSDSNAGDDCGGFMRFVTKADGGGNAERLRILSNGHVAIGDDIANDTGMFKVIAADGQSDDQYVGQFKNLEATTNRSWGLLIQAGSSGTDESLRIRNAANNADHLTVRGNGHITMPSQPLFVAQQVSGTNGSTPISSVSNWIFTNIRVNTGSHFNNTTGFFTCPVSGNYLILADHNYTSSASDWTSIYIFKNSVTIAENWSPPYTAPANPWKVLTASMILNCAANDTISVGSHNSYSRPNTNLANKLTIRLI